MEVRPSETIGDVKTQIEHMQGVPTFMQRLIWRDKTLNNDMELNDDAMTVQECGLNSSQSIIFTKQETKR